VALTGILLGVFLSAHCAAVRSPNRQARTVGQQFYELTPNRDSRHFDATAASVGVW
jgi:hypothetical protein